MPDRKVSLYQLYSEEQANLQNLQCRATFFNLLAYGYKSYEGIAADMELTEASFSQLQDLVFNELTETHGQAERNSDK